MKINGERVQLRDFNKADWGFFAELVGHELTSKFENNRPDAERIRQDFKAALSYQNLIPRRHFNLAICRSNDHKPVGGIHIKLNWEDIREWEIGWALHPEHWKQGYATEAVKLLMGFAFEQLDAHRIVAYANADNLLSERLMIRAGMTKDGVLRETRYCNQTWCDELIYSVLEREWTTGE
jgi:RimJ/RimL family protein N-acetyltransferase